MRAMMASGTVPSTIAGKIRWRSAETKALLSPASHESSRRKPVTGSTKYMAEMRPETGVQPSVTENSRIARMPHQKIGME